MNTNQQKGEYMRLRLIYGRSGTGKSSYMYQEIKNRINKENKSQSDIPHRRRYSDKPKKNGRVHETIPERRNSCRALYQRDSTDNQTLPKRMV